jgi:hypothetical protein
VPTQSDAVFATADDDDILGIGDDRNLGLRLATDAAIGLDEIGHREMHALKVLPRQLRVARGFRAARE